MKTYPSIARAVKGRKTSHRLHLFDKLDGSNLRFEWSRREGWTRFGTRRRVIDASCPVFGCAKGLLDASLADAIAKVAADQGWEALTAYCEFWGPGSLGGQHLPGVAPQLTLFDVAPYRRGFVAPLRFLDFFGELNVPRYLGEYEWNAELIAQVRANELSGVTFEGVVGKAGDGHRILMAKAKTQIWVDAIFARFGAAAGGKLVNS